MRYNSIIFRICLAGAMLGLVLIFQYLERYMPLAKHIMNINLTFIFILPVYFISGYWFGNGVVLIKFLLSPVMSGEGYDVVGVWGAFISAFAAFTFAHFLLLFKHIKFFKSRQKFILAIALAGIITVIIMTVLNGLLFSPVYFKLLKYGKTINFIDYMDPAVWTNFKSLYFGIPTYWGGIFAVFGAGNSINFGIAAAILIPLYTFLIVKIDEADLNRKNEIKINRLESKQAANQFNN